MGDATATVLVKLTDSIFYFKNPKTQRGQTFKRILILISFYYRIINFYGSVGGNKFLMMLGLFSRLSRAVIHHIDRLPSFPVTGGAARGSRDENINNSNNFGQLHCQ